MTGLPDSNKRYYWLKLTESFFTQKEIKQLRRIAGGDVFVIIYLKMLLRSLRDDGKLYYEGIDQDFVSELALDIDEDVENVKVTVAYLQSKGILVNGELNEYELLTAGEMTGSEGESARRMRKMRSQRLLASQSDRLVTGRDTEIEIELEKEKEQEQDILSGFIEFWKIYPHKVKKVQAIRAWQSMKCEAIKDTIIEDVRKRIETEWKGQDIHYIPHPTTYLHGKRWEDETQPSARTGDTKYNPALDYTQREYKNRGSVVYKSINDMPDD